MQAILEQVHRLALKLDFTLNWNTEDLAILGLGPFLYDIGNIDVPT